MRFKPLLVIVLAGAALAVGPGASPAAAAPLAGDFTCAPSCTVVAGTTVSFTASSNAATPSYAWDLTGEQPPNYGQAQGTSVSEQYLQPGTYTIALEITDVSIKQSTFVMHKLTVTPPTADFACTPSCTVATGDSITFTAKSDAIRPSYGWNFSGGSGFTAATGASASHTFSKPGTFTVGLLMADGTSGLTATVTHQVTVSGPAPVPTSLIDTFDNYPAGARVTRDAGGLSFPQGPTIAVVSKVNAATGTAVLAAPPGAGSLELCSANHADGVSLDVGFDDRPAPAGGTWARLVGYNPSGQVVATSSDVQLAAAGHEADVSIPLSITTAGYQIACARVFVGTGTAIHDTGAHRPLIDDLIVPTTLRGPSIAIHTPDDGTTLRQDAAPRDASGIAFAPGGFQNLCAVVTQAPVDPATPPDWSHCPNPNVIPGHRGPLSPDGSFNLQLPLLPVGTDHVTAWVRSAGGAIAHDTVTVTVTATPTISDVRITAMEITQGIQTSPLSTVAPPASRTVAYRGVELVSNRSTWVRVWADTDGATARGVPALLHLYGPHGELPGSPLTADGGPMTLTAGSTTFDQTLRDQLAGSYLFTVPAAMIGGTLAFRAELDPAPDSIAQCGACLANDSLEVTGTRFTPIQTQLVTPVEMFDTIHPGDHPHADPFSDFDPARQAYPFPISMIVPYQGQIDMTSVLQDATDHDQQGTLLGLVGNLERDNSFPGSTIGISTIGGPGGLTSAPTVFCCNPLRVERIAEVNEFRPLTSIAHEYGHVNGLQHASRDCGGGANGQTGADWPPDQHGYIQGVGFDPVFHAPAGAPFITYDPRNPPTDGSGAGTTVLAPGASRHARYDASFSGPQSDYTNQWFDFMSYCADAIPDHDSWISTRNWNQMIDDHRAAADTARAAATPATAARTVAGPGLEVVAVSDKTPSILSVRPEATGAQHSVNSDYHLMVRDATGNVVSDTGVAGGVTHIDQGTGKPAVPIVFIDAVVPASSNAASVQLTHDGAVLATRAASAHAPQVRFLSPGKGYRAKGSGTVTVKWTATDADGDHLTSTVVYSPDAGRHWRTVSVGSTGDSIALPARFLTRSRQARLRVTVSDGWHTTSAVSALFTAAGNPPVPSIEQPARAETLRADAALSLVGEAFGETGRPIAARRLVWRLGRRVLGRGARVAARDLPPGRHRITLQATDGSGRTGTATVSVRVLAVAPIVTALKVPRRVSRHARSLTIRLTSSVFARLTVAHGSLPRRVTVGRRPLTVKITVAASRRPLTLTLRLTAGRKTTRVAIKLSRR